MNRKLQLIGIILVLVALGTFAFWELYGRAYFLTTEVIVTREEIPKGTELTADLFTTLEVDRTAVIEGALTPETLNRIRGTYSRIAIPKNSQVSESFTGSADMEFGEKESVFVLKGEWISLRSSSLRRGDYAEVYFLSKEDEEPLFLGVYRVAFVKDANEAEVSDPSDTGTGDFVTPDLLERSSSTSIISQIEIITTLEEYTEILNRVLENDETAADTQASGKGSSRACLMVVQVPGKH